MSSHSVRVVPRTAVLRPERPFWPQVSAQMLDTTARFANRSFCISCPVGLDFEAMHILDWVAYHHLLGVDCFLLLIDMLRTNLSKPATLNAYNALRRASSLVGMIEVEASEHHISGIAAGFLSALRLDLGVHAPRYFSYIDADEYLVVHEPEERQAYEPCPSAPRCTRAVLRRDANGSTCGARMVASASEPCEHENFFGALHNPYCAAAIDAINDGRSRQAACRRVAHDYPASCGPCAPVSWSPAEQSDHAPSPPPLSHHQHRHDAQQQQQRSPPSLLATLDAMALAERHACGLYLHAWSYGFGADDPATLPRFGELLWRGGGPAGV